MDGSAQNVRDGRLYVEELACTELAEGFGHCSMSTLVVYSVGV